MSDTIKTEERASDRRIRAVVERAERAGTLGEYKTWHKEIDGVAVVTESRLDQAYREAERHPPTPRAPVQPERRSIGDAVAPVDTRLAPEIDASSCPTFWRAAIAILLARGDLTGRAVYDASVDRVGAGASIGYAMFMLACKRAGVVFGKAKE